MNNDKKTSNNDILQQSNRLPCRGCTKDCSDYERCDGKPWRLMDYGDSIEKSKS